MAKTNYNRVEDALKKGLEKIKVETLLEETESHKTSDKSKKERKLSPKQMLLLLKQDLKQIEKTEPKIYETLGIERKRIATLLKDPSQIGEKEAEEIRALYEKSRPLKEKLVDKPSEEILAAEIDRHIYKRHNVKEKWIPLDTHSDWDKFKNPPKR